MLTMADCMTIDDIRRAVDLGFDIVSTTLSHGTAAIDCTMADGPDLPLLRQAAKEFPGFPVVCEGRVHTPGEARAASHEHHELVCRRAGCIEGSPLSQAID